MRPPAGAAWRRTLRLKWAAMIVAAVALASATAIYLARLPKSTTVTVTVSQATDSLGEELFPSMAPDGKTFVFAARQEGNWDIYSQRLGGRRVVNLTADFPGDD